MDILNDILENKSILENNIINIRNSIRTSLSEAGVYDTNIKSSHCTFFGKGKVHTVNNIITTSSIINANCICCDDDGNIYVADASVVTKYRTSGEEVWTVTLESVVTCMDMDVDKFTVYVGCADGNVIGIKGSSSDPIIYVVSGTPIRQLKVQTHTYTSDSYRMAIRNNCYIRTDSGIYSYDYTSNRLLWYVESASFVDIDIIDTYRCVTIDALGKAVTIYNSPTDSRPITDITTFPRISELGILANMIKITIDKFNNIIILTDDGIITKFNRSGDKEFSTKISFSLSESNPIILNTDSVGNIYVANKNKINKFNIYGKLLLDEGSLSDSVEITNLFVNNNTLVYSVEDEIRISTLFENMYEDVTKNMHHVNIDSVDNLVTIFDGGDNDMRIIYTDNEGNMYVHGGTRFIKKINPHGTELWAVSIPDTSTSICNVACTYDGVFFIKRVSTITEETTTDPETSEEITTATETITYTLNKLNIDGVDTGTSVSLNVSDTDIIDGLYIQQTPSRYLYLYGTNSEGGYIERYQIDNSSISIYDSVIIDNATCIENVQADVSGNLYFTINSDVGSSVYKYTISESDLSNSDNCAWKYDLDETIKLMKVDIETGKCYFISNTDYVNILNIDGTLSTTQYTLNHDETSDINCMSFDNLSGNIYIGTGGNIFRISKDTGEILYNYKISDASTISSIYVAEFQIYIGLDDGTIRTCLRGNSELFTHSSNKCNVLGIDYSISPKQVISFTMPSDEINTSFDSTVRLMDSDGNIYTSTYMTGGFYWLVKINSLGDVEWYISLSEEFYHNTNTICLSEDNKYLYIGASTKLSKVDCDTGTSIWNVTTTSVIHSTHVDSNGSVYLSNSSSIEKYNSSGEFLWSYSTTSKYIKSISSNELILVGYSDNNDTGYYLCELNQEQECVWTRALPHNDNIVSYNIYVDKFDDIYVTTSSGLTGTDDHGVRIYKYNKNGVHQFTFNPISTTINANCTSINIHAVYDNGDILISYKSTEQNGNESGLYFRRISRFGQIYNDFVIRSASESLCVAGVVNNSMRIVNTGVSTTGSIETFNEEISLLFIE